MAAMRDWQRNRQMWMRVLEKQTGEGVDAWNRKIAKLSVKDKEGLRAWLGTQGVTGYAQSLLVMEKFGYPDFFVATADELVEQQYRDRPQLRQILEILLAEATKMGEVAVQARKTYVSLVSPRRTFARVQPTTRTRVDLGLRLNEARAGGRLVPSKMHETMRFQIGLSTPEEVDEEVIAWVRQAYAENS